MTVEQMKEAIKKPYPSESWAKKVSKMKDAQIIAVYNKMLNNKQLR